LSTKSIHCESIWRQVSDLSDSLVNFLLPPVCAGCGKVGALVCSECRGQVQWVREPICLSCGKPGDVLVGLCNNCYRHPPSTRQIRAATLHVNPVRRILHLMKYQGYFALADPLATIMFQAWPRWQTQIDIVIPVPLHTERKRKRGYNQAELLVKSMGKKTNWDIVPEALIRRKRTTPQVGLTINQRQRNVRGAFTADESIVSEKRILLVDDVCTTGATIDSAATELLEAGAFSVDAYCLTTVSGSQNISHI